MKINKITKDQILSTIEEGAKIIKRKKELYEQSKKIDKELKYLNECGAGLLGTFGFKAGNDTMNNSANGSGFVNQQDISHVADLERQFDGDGFGDEFSADADETNSLEDLTRENEILKNKLAELLAASNISE